MCYSSLVWLSALQCARESSSWFNSAALHALLTLLQTQLQQQGVAAVRFNHMQHSHGVLDLLEVRGAVEVCGQQLGHEALEEVGQAEQREAHQQLPHNVRGLGTGGGAGGRRR